MAVTPPEPPSSLLERAAQRLEERAAAATAGPWRASGYELYSDVTEEPIVELGFAEGGFRRQEDAAWAAMADPLLAAPLAAMLRDDAVRLSWAGHRDEVDHGYRGFDLARAILGESVPGEDSK
jgi:hypothetical protein